MPARSGCAQHGSPRNRGGSEPIVRAAISAPPRRSGRLGEQTDFRPDVRLLPYSGPTTMSDENDLNNIAAALDLLKTLSTAAVDLLARLAERPEPWMWSSVFDELNGARCIKEHRYDSGESASP